MKENKVFKAEGRVYKSMTSKGLKKSIMIIPCVLIMMALLLMASPIIMAEGDLELITDNAGLLSQDEYMDLLNRAEEISQRYGCDISIITVESMKSNDAFDYADSIRREYNLGYGEDKSILLLFLSMGKRDYALIAHGYGNTAFTDFGKDVILDNYVLPMLGDGDYYGAFSQYLDLSEEYLQMASEGNPFDIEYRTEKEGLPLPIKLAITFLIPIIIAAIVCGIWKSQMKTAILARAAKEYITQEGLVLVKRQDSFLYRTQTRRKIEKETSSSSRGGTTVNKSGTSGRSGKF